MFKLDFSKEEVCIYRYDNGDCKYTGFTDTEELGEIIDQFTQGADYELQYMDGELSGRATNDPFQIYLVAEEQQTPLYIVNTLYNYYGDIIDIENIIKYDKYYSWWGSSELDAFQGFCEECGITSQYPQEIRDYFDYEKYYHDLECSGGFRVLKTDKTNLDQAEYLIIFEY